jgi:AraC-like DNA-binding protein
MTRPTTRPPERVCCRIAADGIELLEAAFEHHVYDRHMHDCYAVGITLRGVQRFWCRGATHDSIPGDAIVINPGEAHDGRSGAAGGYAYRIMYIPIDVWSGVFADVLQRPGAGANVRSPLLHDRRLAQELDAAWMAMADGAPLADELLARCLIRLAAHNGGRPAVAVSLMNESALLRVRDAPHASLGRAVRTADLAAIASTSRFQLSRQFQARFGLPLHAYHLHVRLDEAKRRLTRGEPMAQVAADLGFADQSHFSRRFRGTFGVTPGGWRRATAALS